ncbi:multi-copper oxidase [Mycena maculata]|uniref:Multi-copper oxidase n=1 Tax=Mycena maculata TaxID=230809 RepID=A0AAD7N0H7_9AGAR|nr:multi-copper oxidase [Mycena maculata]
MPEAWPDAEADENALLMDTFPVADGPNVLLASRAPPSLRKRVSAICVLILLLMPFAFMLWLALWVNESPTPEHPAVVQEDVVAAQDMFALDPKFDLGAGQHTRVYRWNVSSVPVSGEDRNHIVVNGRSPGPLIEANVHDRILVYVTNSLVSEGTSIHWHGLPLPLTPFYDGTPGIAQCPIPPGQTLLYNFTFGGWTGTTWWHGHMDMQHTDGLFGPLIVHAPDEVASQKYDTDHVLTLHDVYHTSAMTLLDDYLNSNPTETVPEPVPDRAAINGALGREGEYFEVRVRHGTTTRLRLLNAGTFAPLRVSVDAHVLTLIEADGTPLSPVRVRDVLLQPAQRYSVLIIPDPLVRQGGDEAFWIRVRVVEDGFAHDNPRLQRETLAILRYTSSPLTNTPPNAPLPTSASGPHPDTSKAEVNSWYALPQFDEWVLRPGDDVPPPAAARELSSSDANTAVEANTTAERDAAQNTTAIHSDNSARSPVSVYTLPFTFSIQRTNERNWRSFINGTAWEVPPLREAALVADTAGVSGLDAVFNEGTKVWPGDQLIASLRYGQIVDFVITNLDDGDHPFHLHGYAPWLLGKGRGRFKPAKESLNTQNPMRRDTFTVPKRGWAVVRILTDNSGYWPFHCHIAWHMAGGGLFQIAVSPPPGQALSPLPEDIVAQCAMWDSANSRNDSR